MIILQTRETDEIEREREIDENSWQIKYVVVKVPAKDLFIWPQNDAAAHPPKIVKKTICALLAKAFQNGHVPRRFPSLPLLSTKWKSSQVLCNKKSWYGIGGNSQ